MLFLQGWRKGKDLMGEHEKGVELIRSVLTDADRAPRFAEAFVKEVYSKAPDGFSDFVSEIVGSNMRAMFKLAESEIERIFLGSLVNLSISCAPLLLRFCEPSGFIERWESQYRERAWEALRVGSNCTTQRFRPMFVPRPSSSSPTSLRRLVMNGPTKTTNYSKGRRLRKWIWSAESVHPSSTGQL